MNHDSHRPRLAGPFLIRHGLALALVAALAATGLWLHEHLGRAEAWVLITGAVFGWLLQRSRFCFFCILREWFEERDPRGLLGILVALAVGTLGHVVLFGAWVPDPGAGHLPPRAHIGPVSWVVLLGGLIFGIGMSLSGSCISAHLYRLGEGSVLSVFALLGAVIGFMLGFRTWNSFWNAGLAEASPAWLPSSMGYAGSTTLQLLILAVLAVWQLRHLRPADSVQTADYTLSGLWHRIMVQRWPTWLGGAGIGLIGTVAYLRTEPLGVTAELSRVSRELGSAMGMVPDRLRGLDQVSGCIVTETVQWIGNNGIFVLAMIAAAWASALLAGQFRVERKSLRAMASALGGGILLGFGAMIALGCTIGTLLSGISALAVSGWMFALAMIVGVRVSLPLRRLLLASG
ncbi:YeeE/YedE family protein [Wenzhouxiangella sp. AB-CW3]|uniref:YeeE/YedE family protein n=1 Tax=Wenzhouxiangella sp. AB-CW3 TaxID=2771012 RepID=UPI00168B8C10|nr:YeeE/YedE family protein [Wenzhouxiangella sp. AB-CW3]QOC21602.1 YeeE/YedE family protein [Wenzhouxiangella sp. AB-CW3]